MKIVHINTQDVAGGAARAANRLHAGLCGLGQDSSMFVAYKRSHDASVTTFRPPRNFSARVSRRLRRAMINHSFSRYRLSRPSGYELFSDDRSMYGSAVGAQLPLCDVINLHWVAGFVDHPSFFLKNPPSVPLIWTLHDMYPFTGGCHYDHGCNRYRQECGACPQLGSSDVGDLSCEILKRKMDTVGATDPACLHVVSSSRWLGSEAKASALFERYPISVIPYGLDVDVFAPRNRDFCREIWGIPQDALVVLYVAESLENRRKGYELLTQALAGLSKLSNLFLISVGGGPAVSHLQIPQVNLGYIDNDRLLSFVYSAADVYVMPSLQEAFGQTALESMACGVPVVGFDAGGIPDMVRPGITGELVATKDVEGLRTTIGGLLQNPRLRMEMSGNCRRIVKEEYSLQVQASRYLELYQRCLTEFEQYRRSGQAVAR